MGGDPVDRLLAGLREHPPSPAERDRNLAEYAEITAGHDRRYREDPAYRARFDAAARDIDDYRPDDTPTDPENITVPWDDEEDYR